MPNLLEHIRTCQYDSSIVNANGEIGQVRDGSSPDANRSLVDVTPIEESNRKVHTAVSIIAGTSDQQSITLDESSPVVQVVRGAAERAEATIYGALENINTSTQRCGVRTTGTVIFRKTAPTGTVTGSASDLGKSVIGPRVNSTTGRERYNDGSVQVDNRTFVYESSATYDPGPPIAVNISSNLAPTRNGIGIVLGFVGNYLLVQLDA